MSTDSIAVWAVLVLLALVAAAALWSRHRRKRK